MPPRNVTRSEGEPHERMTRMCAAMSQALQAHPDYSDDLKCFIMLDDGTRAGTQAFGAWEDDGDVLATMMSHLEAVAKSIGFDLNYVPAPHQGQG